MNHICLPHSDGLTTGKSKECFTVQSQLDKREPKNGSLHVVKAQGFQKGTSRDSKRGLLSKRKISYCIESWCPLKSKTVALTTAGGGEKRPEHRHQTRNQLFSLQAAAA